MTSARLAQTSNSLPRFIIRLGILAMYIGYPAGCSLLIWLGGQDNSGAQGDIRYLGYMLIAASALGFFILSSKISFWRFVLTGPSSLDERELKERNAAFQFAYSSLAAVITIAVVYALISTGLNSTLGLGLWLPTSFSDWNLVLWGMMIIVYTLPTSHLAWCERPLD